MPTVYIERPDLVKPQRKLTFLPAGDTISAVMMMEKKLFLMGPTGCGKSKMIRDLLADTLASAGGFVTERSVDENGSFVGYSLLPRAV